MKIVVAAGGDDGDYEDRNDDDITGLTVVGMKRAMVMMMIMVRVKVM